MKLRGVILFVALVLLASVLASATIDAAEPALNASKATITLYLDYGKVLADTRVQFSAPTDGKIEMALPLDSRAITMEVDGKKVDPILEYDLLSYELHNATKVRYQYISEAFVDGNSLVANLRFPVDADAAAIKISLPEKAVLESRMSSGVEIPPVLPKASKLETDGRAISITWTMEDVKTSDDFPVMVRFDFPTNRLAWIVASVSAFVAAIVVLSVVWIFRRRENRRKARSHPKEHHDELDDISKHLKEDEEQVVNILRSREGQCEQGTLRVITGFSKAYLSGLLKELDARKIVIKEKRGKKNLVFLKK